MAIPELHPPDTIYLRAAIGWLELGNPSEAGEDVARISSAGLSHPDVLEVRWQICASTLSWDAALPIGEELVQIAPDRVGSWIHRAYALRRAPGGGLEKAWAALIPAAKVFSRHPVVPYNLACYATQLGRLEEAWEWLMQAVGAGAEREALKKNGAG